MTTFCVTLYFPAACEGDELEASLVLDAETYTQAEETAKAQFVPGWKVIGIEEFN